MTLTLTSGQAIGSDARRELVESARALRERLLADQEETELRGHYSPELHKEFERAGFYRMMAPAKFGGLQVDPGTFFQVITEVARGNPGAAWCLSLGSGHALPMATYWGERAQQEVFGDHGQFIAPHRNQGGFGKAVRVDGGYVVEGTFDYCSGVPYSTHVMLTTRLEEPDGSTSPLVVVVPRDQYTIVDDWGHGETLGMQGSGSNSVVLDKVFVPEHMAVPHDWHEHVGHTPGSRLHGSPLYMGRLTAFYAGEVISVALGTALAALDEYERIIRTKKTIKAPQVLRMETHEAQRVLGLALTLTDAASSILSDVGRLYMELATEAYHGGAPFTHKEDTRLRGRVHQAGQLALQAFDLVFQHAGSGATRRGERMARYYRDMAMFRGHPTALIDTLAVIHAQTYLGI